VIALLADKPGLGQVAAMSTNPLGGFMRLDVARSRGATARALFAIVLIGAMMACAELSGSAATGLVEDTTDSGIIDTGPEAIDGPDGWHASAVECAPGVTWVTVTWVADGDTLFLDGGAKVRLLGIDTPETSSKDCMAAEATQFTSKFAGKGTKVCVTSDKKAGDKDHYGRLLRYVWIKQDGVPVMINARLVRLGLARVYYPFAKGLRHEVTLVRAQKEAEAEGVGGWASCGW